MTLYSLDSHEPKFVGEGPRWIAPDVNIIGMVNIGIQVSIWFGTTIRGDNEPITIGDGSNIQENCVLHTDIGFPLVIGKSCTIGHKVMLHGCDIAENSLIGMGATVLNGAKIGMNSVVGAGSLVPEGKSVDANSLYLGIPARFVRHIDKEEHEKFLYAAKHYQQNIEKYRKGLKVIA